MRFSPRNHQNFLKEISAMLLFLSFCAFLVFQYLGINEEIYNVIYMSYSLLIPSFILFSIGLDSNNHYSRHLVFFPISLFFFLCWLIFILNKYYNEKIDTTTLIIMLIPLILISLSLWTYLKKLLH